ncbi:hypothetical protein [Dyella mobilis]|uniref:Vitamin B12 transport system permease protein n=1 Tax=Dyella mobilis TaxID=1849582 RepID=A0ABS2KGY1_9GAMM|nr:hypothetical protein [Dyella mobilis]MBM7130428.1 hypothetical protein [Dyella mobilis]GLQ97055.1 hypothetical protein GCM10007863_14750 [Dyella mobilis]
MFLRQLIGECFALFCSVMLGLAAGAVWLVPTVYLRRPLPWLALPAGWLLAIAIRQWVHGRRWHAAPFAVLATLVASAYIRVLVSAVNISAMTGYSLVEAMRTAGLPMLLDFARISLSPADVAWSLAGAALAAFTAWREPRRSARTVD